MACRGPWDVVNLAAVWGLGQERGFEAVSKECRNVVVTAGLKRTSYRGVVDVVYGGEKPAAVVEGEKEEGGKGEGKEAVNGQKRKADIIESAEKPLSKRQMKRQAHQARLAAASEKEDVAAGADDGTENGKARGAEGTA